MSASPDVALKAIRKQALEYAASFYIDTTPIVHDLWTVAAFYEAFRVGGAEATREAFGPAQSKLRVVK